jgi:uncharacterized protein
MLRTLALILLLPALAPGQSQPYPGQDLQTTYKRLLGEIQKIPIFDHHGHPGFADDPDVDAMAAPPNYSSPLRERLDNPEMIAAMKALWGYPYDDMSPEHTRWLVSKKAQLRKQLGDAGYWNSILDKLGIETAAANRAMMDYLDPKRFKWVFFADSFMWPFNNRDMAARNPDEEVYIPLQEKMLHRWMQQEGVSRLPATFADYLKFVSRTLEDNQRKGGIAMKFEAAYFRSLHFGNPPRAEAEAVYAKFHAGGIPSPQEYTTFQDYIFRYLVSEGGRLHLPVHIHTAIGIGDYFDFTHGNIMNLENVLRDPHFSNVTWVMIHGGYPLEREAIWLAAMKNVYLDSSLMELDVYPAQFKNSLKEWLELFPDKVTYGSDCFPYNDAMGAEESYWLAVQTVREALAGALAEMVSEQEISESRALQMAHAYLHDTAAGLYK